MDIIRNLRDQRHKSWDELFSRIESYDCTPDILVNDIDKFFKPTRNSIRHCKKTKKNSKLHKRVSTPHSNELNSETENLSESNNSSLVTKVVKKKNTSTKYGDSNNCSVEEILITDLPDGDTKFFNLDSKKRSPNSDTDSVSTINYILECKSQMKKSKAMLNRKKLMGNFPNPKVNIRLKLTRNYDNENPTGKLPYKLKDKQLKGENKKIVKKYLKGKIVNKISGKIRNRIGEKNNLSSNNQSNINICSDSKKDKNRTNESNINLQDMIEAGKSNIDNLWKELIFTPKSETNVKKVDQSPIKIIEKYLINNNTVEVCKKVPTFYTEKLTTPKKEIASKRNEESKVSDGKILQGIKYAPCGKPKLQKLKQNFKSHNNILQSSTINIQSERKDSDKENCQETNAQKTKDLKKTFSDSECESTKELECTIYIKNGQDIFSYSTQKSSYILSKHSVEIKEVTIKTPEANYIQTSNKNGENKEEGEIENVFNETKELISQKCNTSQKKGMKKKKQQFAEETKNSIAIDKMGEISCPILEKIGQIEGIHENNDIESHHKNISNKSVEITKPSNKKDDKESKAFKTFKTSDALSENTSVVKMVKKQHAKKESEIENCIFIDKPKVISFQTSDSFIQMMDDEDGQDIFIFNKFNRSNTCKTFTKVNRDEEKRKNENSKEIISQKCNIPSQKTCMEKRQKMKYEEKLKNKHNDTEDYICIVEPKEISFSKPDTIVKIYSTERKDHFKENHQEHLCNTSLEIETQISNLRNTKDKKNPKNKSHNEEKNEIEKFSNYNEEFPKESIDKMVKQLVKNKSEEVEYSDKPKVINFQTSDSEDEDKNDFVFKKVESSNIFRISLKKNGEEKNQNKNYIHKKETFNTQSRPVFIVNKKCPSNSENLEQDSIILNKIKCNTSQKQSKSVLYSSNKQETRCLNEYVIKKNSSLVTSTPYKNKKRKRRSPDISRIEKVLVKSPKKSKTILKQVVSDFSKRDGNKTIFNNGEVLDYDNEFFSDDIF